jgi:phospholipid/cholesterol/gamma-HCH transport system substrate-binding protein
VSAVSLQRDRVTLTLSVDAGRRIPANSLAHVYALSVVGEQYLDFVPTSDSGPYLHAGSVVPATQTTTPLETSTVLLDLEQWLKSLDPHDVTTVSSELATAFGGAGSELRQILSSGEVLTDELSRSQPAYLDLLRTSHTLLDTAAAHAGDLSTFASSLLALSATLKDVTPAETRLVDQAPSTTQLIDGIVKDNAASAAVVLDNLATLSRIQDVNVPAFAALLSAVPETGRLVPLVVRNGSIQAAALFNYTEPVCAYGAPLPSPLDPHRAAAKDVACPDPQPGELVRGADNAPRPTSAPNSGYLVTDSGQVVQLGWNGGQDDVLGADSWTSLIVSGGAR